MSFRNATASWSGYSHQGKVGLFIALRTINAVNAVGLNQFRLELETQEDAKLIQNGSVIEVHQVKAILGGTTISVYTDALTKFEACNGRNYLHTVRQITNWQDLTDQQNPRQVVRYPYSGTNDYCLLNEIDTYILIEIKTALTIQGHQELDNDHYCKGCFEEFLGLLDERLRTEHQNGNQNTYNVGFGLDEINNILTRRPNRHKATMFAIRRTIFDRYVEFMENLEQNHVASISADHETFVLDIIQQICSLNDTDLELFLNQIFPDSTKGKNIARCSLTDDFFVSKDFTSTFLYTLISIEKEKLVLQDGTFPHYKVDFNYLLTALQCTDITRPTVVQNILENDKLNATRYETDFIINEHLSGKLTAEGQRLIDRSGSFFAEKELEFITRADAVRNLN